MLIKCPLIDRGQLEVFAIGPLIAEQYLQLIHSRLELGMEAWA